MNFAGSAYIYSSSIVAQLQQPLIPSNKLLLSPLRGWDALLAASLCFGRPKARRYGARNQRIEHTHFKVCLI